MLANFSWQHAFKVEKDRIIGLPVPFECRFDCRECVSAHAYQPCKIAHHPLKLDFQRGDRQSKITFQPGCHVIIFYFSLIQSALFLEMRSQPSS